MMKKSLIALAVLAASGAAMAQSTVTLYGVADVWLGSKKVETNGVGLRQTVIDTSGVNGSRWGLKGTEDLGGGLKAVFQLENGFSQDTGAFKTANTMFDRQAYVGLAGGFGQVSMGRQYSAYDDLHGAYDPNFDAFTFTATGSVAANGMADYTNRVNNSIKFQSANYSGFSGAVLYGLGENKNAGQPISSTNSALDNAGGSATDILSLNVQYANGPLVVGYAHQEEKQRQATVGLPQDKNKYDLVGGTYDFGVAKLNGFYNQAKNNATKDKEYSIGAIVPFGAAAISVDYAHSKSDTGAVSYTGKGYSVLATYDMSKRTRLYAGAQQTKAFVPTSTSPLGSAISETKTTTYGVGLRTSF